MVPDSPPPGSLPGLPAHRKPSSLPFYWCWGPCLQCNAKLQEQINAMSTHSTVHGTDLSVGGYPDLSPPYLPPSILFLHPSLSFSLRGREATRGARASPWKLARETPFLSWAPPSSSVTRRLSHLPFRELLALLPGTARASQTGVGRVSVLSASRHSFPGYAHGVPG